VVQRQLKHALAGNPTLYSREDLDQLITRLAAAQARIFTIQRKWTRYWLLKYLEQEDFETLTRLCSTRTPVRALLIPDMFLERMRPFRRIPNSNRRDGANSHRQGTAPKDILKIQILDTPPSRSQCGCLERNTVNRVGRIDVALYAMPFTQGSSGSQDAGAGFPGLLPKKIFKLPTIEFDVVPLPAMGGVREGC